MDILISDFQYQSSTLTVTSLPCLIVTVLVVVFCFLETESLEPDEVVLVLTVFVVNLSEAPVIAV